MDQADEELRETIMKIWPLQSKKMIDLLVPQKSGKILEIEIEMFYYKIVLKQFKKPITLDASTYSR